MYRDSRIVDGLTGVINTSIGKFSSPLVFLCLCELSAQLSEDELVRDGLWDITNCTEIVG